jgi:hypothetical protein
MKKFKDFLNEEMMPFAQTEKGFVGVDNGPVRDNINIHLAAVTSRCCSTPYHAMEMVRKVLAAFSIFPPQTNFLDGDSGHEVFPISQFGNKMGMTNDGTVVVKNYDPYYIYFEYQMNDMGSFDIFCEIVEESELQEILDDIESEMEDGETTDGDEADAEDSFDSYKADNGLKEEVESIVEQVLSENSLKDFQPPFKAEGLYVSDKRGNSVLEVTKHGKVAQEVAKALNMHMSHIKEDYEDPKEVEHTKNILSGARRKGDKKKWKRFLRDAMKRATTGMNEEQQLDELDTETLKSYIDKAGKNKKYHGKKTLSTDKEGRWPETKHHLRKFLNRKAGIEAAYKNIEAKGPFGLAEEPLNELRGKSSLSKKEREKLKQRIRDKHSKAWDETQNIRRTKKSFGPSKDTKDIDSFRNRLGGIYNKLEKKDKTEK